MLKLDRIEIVGMEATKAQVAEATRSALRNLECLHSGQGVVLYAPATCHGDVISDGWRFAYHYAPRWQATFVVDDDCIGDAYEPEDEPIGPRLGMLPEGGIES